MEEVKPKKGIQKIIDNNVTRAVGIITATVIVIGFFYGPILENKDRIKVLELTASSQEDIKEAIANLKDNHIHSIEEDIDDINNRQEEFNNQLIEIKTILDERLPR